MGAAGSVGDLSVVSAPRRLPTLLIDVTRPLGSLADRLVTQSAITIRLETVDGRNAPLKELDWSVQSVRLEQSGRN